ncbi:MAG: TPM domain-containing protein [Coriobacteriales bacterium]|nr:TPM domain-containing protein [Coriobacteriales bacterium]
MSCKRFCWLGAALMLLCLVFIPCVAPDVAYAKGPFVVDDQADLLTSSQRRKLKDTYAEFSEYADAAFVTTDEPSSDVKDFARSYVKKHYGSDPAVIFVIDMYNRKVCVYANDAGLGLVSDSDARAIADNVYKLATKGDYYGCADAALSQMLAICKGGKIARPMKHITNFLVAIIGGVLINFFVLYRSRAKVMQQRASSQSMRGMAQLPTVTKLEPVVTDVSRYRRSSSHGGGGGGGGGSHSF